MAERLSHRPYYMPLLVQRYADLHISIALACSTLQDEQPIAQLRYWLNSYSKVQYTT